METTNRVAGNDEVMNHGGPAPPNHCQKPEETTYLSAKEHAQHRHLAEDWKDHDRSRSFRND
jgi:hypothetical protein